MKDKDNPKPTFTKTDLTCAVRVLEYLKLHTGDDLYTRIHDTDFAFAVADVITSARQEARQTARKLHTKIVLDIG